MNTKLKLAIGSGGAILLGGFFLGRTGLSHKVVQPTPMPPVLEKVQALGDLHTARYTYQNIFEHATEREPEEWADNVPGVASFVRAATRNTALVGVNVEVEAGVNLEKAKMCRGVNGAMTLQLPEPTVYKPLVEAKVYETHRGMFWRDDNISNDAIVDAQTRLKDEALRDGIVKEAKKNAINQLSHLIPEITSSHVAVVFS